MTPHLSSKMFFAGLQWLFFMLANTVVIPLSIGAAFDLSQAEIASSLQRSFIYTGFACILQAVAGHRYPLMEGQSGLWWGVILSLSASAASAEMSLGMMGGAISIGIILSGILLSILGALGLGKLLNKLFTPVVMSVVLFLLSSQLILIFFKGMIGLSEGSQVHLPTAGLSFLLVLFVSWLNIRGRGLVSNFSILIGISAGWVAYALLFGQEDPIEISGTPSLSLFPWGEPNVQAGIMMTVILTGLINTTNTIAALRGAEPLFNKPIEESQYRRSFIVTGLNSIVSGLFGLVPYAPYISSIGFLQSTRILERTAFILGALFFMILGFVPLFSSFFSSMPISVGDAVLFVAYLQLFGGALRNIEGIAFTPKTIYRIAAPTLLGMAIMNIPAEMYGSIPLLIRPLVSNGLLMGILLSVILENFINWSQWDAIAGKSAEHKKAG